MIWRILTSTRLHTTVTEMEAQWCYDDLVEAHAVLDALEDAEMRARETD